MVICKVPVTVCYNCPTYMFQSESILYSYMNIKEFFAQNRRDIWSLSDTNGIQSQEHLIQKQTLSHLAKQATRLSCVVITYLYYGFGCILLSYYLRVSEWIYTPKLPEFWGNRCSKHAWNLKFEREHSDLSVRPLSSSTNTQPFRQIGQSIKLSCAHL